MTTTMSRINPEAYNTVLIILYFLLKFLHWNGALIVEIIFCMSALLFIFKGEFNKVTNYLWLTVAINYLFLELNIDSGAFRYIGLLALVSLVLVKLVFYIKRQSL
jgi:hypothetical protein